MNNAVVIQSLELAEALGARKERPGGFVMRVYVPLFGGLVLRWWPVDPALAARMVRRHG